MASWIDVNAELPLANRIMDVCVELSQGRMTQLRAYRLATPASSESVWLNAITHKPFPTGWRITKWRTMKGEAGEDQPLRITDLVPSRQRA